MIERESVIEVVKDGVSEVVGLGKVALARVINIVADIDTYLCDRINGPEDEL